MKFTDKFKFFRCLSKSPKTTGAVAPSGRQLARAMAQEIELEKSGLILELGPGTGVVTKAILDIGIPSERLVVVEYSEMFCELLQTSYPGIRIVNGDAFAIRNSLTNIEEGSLAAVVSSLPLLNSPIEKRKRLLIDALALLQPGAPYIQFSYGPSPPIPLETDGVEMKKTGWLLLNIPPARVWTYRKINRD